MYNTAEAKRSKGVAVSVTPPGFINTQLPGAIKNSSRPTPQQGREGLNERHMTDPPSYGVSVTVGPGDTFTL